MARRFSCKYSPIESKTYDVRVFTRMHCGCDATTVLRCKRISGYRMSRSSRIISALDSCYSMTSRALWNGRVCRWQKRRAGPEPDRVDSWTRTRLVRAHARLSRAATGCNRHALRDSSGPYRQRRIMRSCSFMSYWLAGREMSHFTKGRRRTPIRVSGDRFFPQSTA